MGITILTTLQPRKLKGVWINESAREVWVDGIAVDPPLSAAQYTLLLLLYQHLGQIVSRPQIVKTVWDDADPRGVSANAVDGLITRLRARLQEAQPKYDYVEVIRGQGVRLRETKE